MADDHGRVIDVRKPKRQGWHNRAKTSCPRGHPYSPENTRLSKSGSRTCRTCERERSYQPRYGKFAAGWRDQECPICGAKWFVNASIHVRKIHGQRLPGLVSDALLGNRRILLAELNHFSADPKAIQRRHRRWIDAIVDEQAAGGAYIKRLAKRWRVPYRTASGRVDQMTERALVSRTRKPTDPRRSPRDERSTCKRGHAWADNAYLNKRGIRVCRACLRELHRLRQEKLGRIVRSRYPT